jgi:hypothetical protein
MHQSRMFRDVESGEEVRGVWVQDVVGWDGGIGVEDGAVGRVGVWVDEVVAVAWIE